MPKMDNSKIRKKGIIDRCTAHERSGRVKAVYERKVINSTAPIA